MIIYMIDTRGRARISAFVKRAIAWNRTSAVKVGAMPGRPSRETIQRIVAGEQVSDVMLMALGDKLGLPRDFLIYIGTGDIRKIEASARPGHDGDPDLIRWTLEMMRESGPDLREQWN
jgi:hypothetical protein